MLDIKKLLTYHWHIIWGQVKKGFTSRYRPWRLEYIKEYSNKKSALAAERKLKYWKSRIMIERLITGEIDI